MAALIFTASSNCGWRNPKYETIRDGWGNRLHHYTILCHKNLVVKCFYSAETLYSLMCNSCYAAGYKERDFGVTAVTSGEIIMQILKTHDKNSQAAENTFLLVSMQIRIL